MERLRNRLDVYRADLAQIVSKYIGETERRLGALFTRAESRDAVVILDEGDDLFGNRGEVRVVSNDVEGSRAEVYAARATSGEPST